MKTLVLNAGSPSLKFAVFDGGLGLLLKGQVSGIGHRIVHGGTRYVTPVRVNDAVQHELEALRALAPLHLPFGRGVPMENVHAVPANEELTIARNVRAVL